MTPEELRQKTIEFRSQKKGDYLYFIQSDKSGMIKIGRSKHPEKRLRQLQTGNSHKLKLIIALEGQGWREPDLHSHLKDWRIRSNGEWFHYDCVGSIPTDIYEQIPYGALDDWWES
jgi:hypothetical protein